MRTVLIVVLALALLGGAVVALAPAAILAPYIERASQQRVTLTETEGRLWHGRGVLAAGGTRVPLAWDAEALPLLSGELKLRVKPGEANAATPRAQVDAANRRIAITDLDLVLPADSVQQALLRNAPIKPGWKADGEITIWSSRVEWTPAVFGGGIDALWRNAHLTLVSSTPVDLGDMTVQLAGAGNRLAGPVRNRGGNLDVRGDLALGTDGSVNASLLLTPRTEDAELARALAAIGTPEGKGWRIAWQTPAR